MRRLGAAPGSSGGRDTVYNTTDAFHRTATEDAMPDEPRSLLDALIGEHIVIDLRSTYVALGTLVGGDELFVELKNADLHDLRDTDTTRENYIAESKATGIKRNRKRVLIVRTDMVAVARLAEVVDD
jgi:hypothetical protein